MPVFVFAVEAIRLTVMSGVTAVAGVMALHDAHRWLGPPAMFVQQCCFLAWDHQGSRASAQSLLLQSSCAILATIPDLKIVSPDLRPSCTFLCFSF